MNKHFKRKRVCANINDLVLTDEIKQIILQDHVYHKPKQPKKIIQNITNNNNNNILNYNVMSTMNPEQQIDTLMEHLKKEMPGLSDTKYFARRRKYLLTHKDDKPNDSRTIDDLFKEILDFLESFLEEDNIIYNCFIKHNLLHIYNDDEWEKRTIPKGMTEFIKIMKIIIFDAYEVCLIRQMTNWKLSQQARDALREYYSFIHSFNVRPTFMEERNNDNKLLYNKNEPEYDNESYSSYEIIDQLNEIWKTIETDMKDYKKNKTTTQLKQIISHHTDQTMKELDKNINNYSLTEPCPLSINESIF